MITANSASNEALISAAAEAGVRTVVVNRAAGWRDLDLLCEGFDEVFLLDSDRTALEARVTALPHSVRGRVRPLAGTTVRAMADASYVMPQDVMFVWSREGRDDAGDALFYAPRGKGLIALVDFAYTDVQDQLLRWSPNHTVERVAFEDGRSMLLVRPQRTLHVTFLIEKYTHEYGKSGLSINLDNLVATLHQTGFASYDVVHYDEWFHERRESIRPEDLRGDDSADDHVLVFVLHYHSPANPSVELLRAAKQNGSKLVAVWLDKLTSSETSDHVALADLNVILDGQKFDLPNAWPIFTPKNPVFFRDPGLERTIDVSFIGETRYLKQRQDFLDRLQRETRIDATIISSSAADTKRKRTIEEFAHVLQTSKISIALTKDRVKQLKGRIFETMLCGAAVACDPNPHIAAYFTPDVDYIAFRTYDELIDKCAHLLAHPDELERIRRAGHAKVTKYYNHRVFWQSLLARVGVLPGSFPKEPS